MVVVAFFIVDVARPSLEYRYHEHKEENSSSFYPEQKFEILKD